MKSFIHSLSKLVWIKRGFFIRTSFDRLWMEIFPFLFLILKGFYKGFQMRYHLFFNSNGKAVKTIKMFFWKSAVCNQELVSVLQNYIHLWKIESKSINSDCTFMEKKFGPFTLRNKKLKVEQVLVNSKVQVVGALNYRPWIISHWHHVNHPQLQSVQIVRRKGHCCKNSEKTKYFF